MLSISVVIVILSIFVFCVGLEYFWWFVRHRKKIRNHENSEIESMLFQIDRLQMDINKTLSETTHYPLSDESALDSAHSHLQ